MKLRFAWAAAGLSASALGCAPATAPRSAHELVAAGIEEGLPLRDPFRLDREIRVQVEEAVGTRGDRLERLHRLRDYLSRSGTLGFRYAPITYDANEAFRERRGDCMAYTLLFVALARDLDLPAYVVHVAEVKNYYERSGWFFVSSHVAVGFDRGPNAVVIDLSNERRDASLAMYESIDDAAAAALFFNNVAVDHMLRGDMRDAERMLRFLHRREPSVVELTNNLGVLLNREHRYRDALAVLSDGIARAPTYEPFYTNAIHAARGAEMPAVARDLERRGQRLEEEDPYFLFARGVGAFQENDFGRAADQLERAADAKPDSPAILGWLARAYLARGERDRGRRAFEKAWRLAPSDPAVLELRRSFPELR
ncbi:MAG TPA: tetratricopeptide repeat protein [Minicystis sp.]|nr:tetratricopeptide repeat protein [Minicystis sp.]